MGGYGGGVEEELDVKEEVDVIVFMIKLSILDKLIYNLDNLQL